DSSHCWLVAVFNWITHSLCSPLITRASSLLRSGPSLGRALVLWALWDPHLAVSLGIASPGSHVPCQSPICSHATSRPDATQAGHRFPLSSSRVNDFPPVLTSFLRFRPVCSGSLAFVSTDPT